MEEDNTTVEKLHKEIVDFRKTMEELHVLKQVAADLRSFRRMLKLRKYD